MTVKNIRTKEEFQTKDIKKPILYNLSKGNDEEFEVKLSKAEKDIFFKLFKEEIEAHKTRVKNLTM